MRKKDIGTLMVGMALGAALTGGAAAAGILAEPSWSPIYVDGQQVQMTAYNILGNNYVKLRDIGQAVGFNVYYQDGVQVDSDAPYTGEALIQSKAPAAASLQVSSYKGNTLKAGDRSMLIISPKSGTCSASSSAPSVAALEQVAGYWVIVAQAPGSATITVTNDSGDTGRLALTVGETVGETAPPAELDLTANMDIRLEMVRLINEVRQKNGRTELPVNDALMNAAQDVSAQCVTEHRPYDHHALIRYGWPHAGMYNLVKVNLASFPNAAEKSVDAWVKSPGHFATMLMEEASCVGTGVTIKDGDAYCYMVVGDPTAHNPYEE